MSRTSRTAFGILLAAVILAGIAGCTFPASTSSASKTPAPTPTVTVTVTQTVTATPAPIPTAAPVLGQAQIVGQYGGGFGEVMPKSVLLGGDPTGLIDDITWSTWGGPTATGTGTTPWVDADHSVADAPLETAIITAYDLGICDGQLMYQNVVWYFPQHGETFDQVVSDNYSGFSDCTPKHFPD